MSRLVPDWCQVAFDEGFRVNGEPNQEIINDARDWARQIATRFNKAI